MFAPTVAFRQTYNGSVERAMPPLRRYPGLEIAAIIPILTVWLLHLGGSPKMTLLLRDDHGILHPVHDATQEEIVGLARRAWRTNWDKAAEIGMLPEPIYGLKSLSASAP